MKQGVLLFLLAILLGCTGNKRVDNSPIVEVTDSVMVAKAPIKREQSDAGINSAEREEARPKVKGYDEVERCGIGRMLHEALELRLKEQGILNMNACISFIETEDEYLTQDSVRFHEQLGYKKVAHFHLCGKKFGRWYDMIWMEKIIGEHL